MGLRQPGKVCCVPMAMDDEGGEQRLLGWGKKQGFAPSGELLKTITRSSYAGDNEHHHIFPHVLQDTDNLDPLERIGVDMTSA
ncbi:hypothetical protein WISP_145723 [Willisornis vidua]|uniref:Uncharacterized protein n=1 Tax=Willisornis vidua TaxID=1566151 RepID=A0ABQ9CNH6_9PASS|nr:hypothetical protein WISP_145723 [Willisornis vidua]